MAASSRSTAAAKPRSTPTSPPAPSATPTARPRPSDRPRSWRSTRRTASQPSARSAPQTNLNPSAPRPSACQAVSRIEHDARQHVRAALCLAPLRPSLGGRERAPACHLGATPSTDLGPVALLGRSLRTQPIDRSRGPGQGGERGRTTLTRPAAEGDWAECEASERPLDRPSHYPSLRTRPATSREHAPYLTSNHTGECRKQVDMFRTAPCPERWLRLAVVENT